jgi:hypothetical protein
VSHYFQRNPGEHFEKGLRVTRKEVRAGLGHPVGGTEVLRSRNKEPRSRESTGSAEQEPRLTPKGHRPQRPDEERR